MRIGLIQFAGCQSKQENIDKLTRYIGQAVEQGAQLICPHELATTIYFPFEEHARYFAWAEPVPGPSTDHFARVARDHGVVLLLPLFEQVGGSDYFNTTVVLGPDGEIVGRYRKSSIPHIRRNGVTPTGFEKYYFRPGDLGFPVFPTPFGLTLGTIICFDRHFPEHFRALALQGAQLVCVPTTSPRTGERAWLFELQAAAFMNGLWVAGVNRVGYDQQGSTGDWFGSSVLINPRGDVVAQASDRDEQVLVADLDPAEADELRAAWGFFRDRRPEAYGVLTR